MSFFQEKEIDYFIVNKKSLELLDVKDLNDFSIIYISENIIDLEDAISSAKKITSECYFILNGSATTESIKKLSREFNVPILIFRDPIDDISEITNFIQLIFSNNRLVCVDYNDFSEIYSGEECHFLEIENSTEALEIKLLLEKTGKNIKSATFLFHSPSIASANSQYSKVIDELYKSKSVEINSLFSVKKSKDLSKISILLSCQ